MIQLDYTFLVIKIILKKIFSKLNNKLIITIKVFGTQEI